MTSAHPSFTTTATILAPGTLTPVFHWRCGWIDFYVLNSQKAKDPRVHQAPLFRRRAKQREMIPETGLEAGDAIGYERSCFKASSGNHSSSKQHQHLLLYCLLPHTQVLYCFRLQNILNSSFPRRETRKGIHYIANNAVPQGV